MQTLLVVFANLCAWHDD